MLYFRSVDVSMLPAGLLKSSLPRLLVCSGIFNWSAAMGGGPVKGFNNPEVSYGFKPVLRIRDPVDS